MELFSHTQKNVKSQSYEYWKFHQYKYLSKQEELGLKRNVLFEDEMSGLQVSSNR